MKIFLSILMVLATTQAFAQLTDKQTHAVVSAGLTMAGYTALRQHDMEPASAVAYSAGAVFLVGLAKELAVDDKPDWQDVAANMVGIYAGVIFPLTFRW